MESEIKIGQQFEFALHADKGLRQKAVVTRVLSNREEALGSGSGLLHRRLD
jgi:hypothetical protein